MRFIALLHPPASGSLWGVTFPDLPGCTSSGASFEDASTNAIEALRGHLAAMRDDGDPIPSARTLDAIRSDPNETEDIADSLPLLVNEKSVPEPAF